MSSYYGVLYPSFWTGHTGLAIRKAGGKDALLLGAYLISNDHMNMIGVYRLPLATVRTELGLTAASIARGLSILHDEEFAYFDEVTAFVWVREMARIRLGIAGNSPLDRKDKRRIGAERLYESLAPNPFLGPFFDRYRQVLQLRRRREDSLSGGNENSLQAQPPVTDIEAQRRDFEGASKGLRRGLQGASKSDQKQVQKQVQQKDTSSGAGAPRRPNGDDTPQDNLNIITKIAHEAIGMVGDASHDLGETVKTLCATRHIAYDSAIVRKAIESAQFQRRRMS